MKTLNQLRQIAKAYEEFQSHAESIARYYMTRFPDVHRNQRLRDYFFKDVGSLDESDGMLQVNFEYFRQSGCDEEAISFPVEWLELEDQQLADAMDAYHTGVVAERERELSERGKALDAEIRDRELSQLVELQKKYPNAV